MKRISIVSASLLAVFAAACGGGSTPTTPSSSSVSPTPTPAPSTVSVYASNDNRVAWFDGDPKVADQSVQGGMIGVGWQSNEYGTVGTGTGFKFDVSSQVAGRTVKKATLRLYVTDPPREFSVRPELRLNAFASGWDPATLSWNVWSALACQTAGEVRLPAPAAAGSLDFDVTTIVQNWASGTWGNYGLRLMVDRPDAGAMGRISTTWFSSLEVYTGSTERPQIVIEFQ